MTAIVNVAKERNNIHPRAPPDDSAGDARSLTEAGSLCPPFLPNLRQQGRSNAKIPHDLVCLCSAGRACRSHVCSRHEHDLGLDASPRLPPDTPKKRRTALGALPSACTKDASGRRSLCGGSPAGLFRFGAARLFALAAGLLLLTAVRNIGRLDTRTPEDTNEHRRRDNAEQLTHKSPFFPMHWRPILQETGLVCKEKQALPMIDYFLRGKSSGTCPKGLYRVWVQGEGIYALPHPTAETSP
jgi:hypothetical protein